LTSKAEAKTNLFLKNKGTYLTASEVQIRNRENGLSMSIRIIVDPGCPSSLITNTTANLLQLQQSTAKRILVKGFLDEDPKILETATVSFEIFSLETDEIHNPIYSERNP